MQDSVNQIAPEGPQDQGHYTLENDLTFKAGVPAKDLEFKETPRGKKNGHEAVASKGPPVPVLKYAARC